MKAWRSGSATSPRVLRPKDLPMLKAAIRLGTLKHQRTRERETCGKTPSCVVEGCACSVPIMEIVNWTWTIGNEWVSATKELLELDPEVLSLLYALPPLKGLEVFR